MSTIAGASSTYGLELLSANLAKSAQEQQGRTVLQLLDSTASSTAQVPPSVPQGNLGNSINIRV